VKIIYIQLLSNIRSQLKITKRLENRSAEENDMKAKKQQKNQNRRRIMLCF